VQDDGVSCRIEIRGATAGAKLNMMLVEPAVRLGDNFAAPASAFEVLAVEARAMVRAIDFLPDQKNRARGIEPADGVGGRAARQPTPNQQVFVMVFQHFQFLAAPPRTLYGTIGSMFRAQAAVDCGRCCADKHLWSIYT